MGTCCACMHCRVHSLRPWSSQLLIISTLSRSIAMGSMSPPPAVNNYYRADGVRITHDPHAPGMAEKYGRPGETDNEGFDPYADTVGPGIYGGIVKRDAHGTVVIGRQYQNHNPRPGPVYAGGGNTPTCRALGDNERLAALLDKFPDLVNDISTGGAQPLHNCGMSQANQHSTSLLISRGADIEAIDSYGYTPLHRMASNNLPIGAQALLDAGADPQFRGGSGQTPMQVAQSSHAERSSISALPNTMYVAGALGLSEDVLNTSGSLITNKIFLLFLTVTRIMPGTGFMPSLAMAFLDFFSLRDCLPLPLDSPPSASSISGMSSSVDSSSDSTVETFTSSSALMIDLVLNPRAPC